MIEYGCNVCAYYNMYLHEIENYKILNFRHTKVVAKLNSYIKLGLQLCHLYRVVKFKN